MKVLFLTTTLSLIAFLQAQNSLDNASEKDVTGLWYIKAMVVDSKLPKEKRFYGVSPVTVTALRNGVLEASQTFMKEGQCHEKKVILQSTGQPGTYSGNVDKKNLKMQKMMTENHYVVFAEGQCHGKPFRMAKLMSRDPEMNYNALEEFKNFTEVKGLPEEKIFFPTQIEKCIPESESI